MPIRTVSAPEITSAPSLPKRAAGDLLGYWYNTPDSSWERIGCSHTNEAYTTSGPYAGCFTPIYTGCVPLGITATGEVNSLVETCTNSTFPACQTQTIYDASSLISNGRYKVFCGITGYSNLVLFRTTTPSGTSSSTISSSIISTSSTPDSASTAPSSAAPTAAASESPSPQPSSSNSKSSVSPAVIAGATVAGAALLLVITFLAWFFGFYKKKIAGQIPSTYVTGYQSGGPKYAHSPETPEYVGPAELPSPRT